MLMRALTCQAAISHCVCPLTSRVWGEVAGFGQVFLRGTSEGPFHTRLPIRGLEGGAWEASGNRHWLVPLLSQPCPLAQPALSSDQDP